MWHCQDSSMILWARNQMLCNILGDAIFNDMTFCHGIITMSYNNWVFHMFCWWLFLALLSQSLPGSIQLLEYASSVFYVSPFTLLLSHLADFKQISPEVSIGLVTFDQMVLSWWPRGLQSVKACFRWEILLWLIIFLLLIEEFRRRQKNIDYKGEIFRLHQGPTGSRKFLSFVAIGHIDSWALLFIL